MTGNSLMTKENIREYICHFNGYLNEIELATKDQILWEVTKKSKHLEKMRSVGFFAAGQIIPICYFLGVVDVTPMQASQAYIGDNKKPHFAYSAGNEYWLPILQSHQRALEK